MAGLKRPYLVPACVIAGILVLVGMTLATGAKPSAFMVTVDGKEIGLVKDAGEVEKCVEAMLAEARTVWPADLEIMSNIECIPYKKVEKDPGNPELLTPEQISDRLSEALEFSAKAYVVEVEGRDVVALRDQAAAEEVMRQIQEGFTAQPGKKGASVKVDEVRIIQQVNIVAKRVPVDSLKEPEEARQILLRGTDKIDLYTVQKGDSLWSIARARNMTVDQLKKANSQLQGDRLQIGQTLNLIVPEPYVNVVSVETVTQEVVVPFQVSISQDEAKWPWQMVVTRAGVPGRKEVVLEISKKDGREVGRKIISEKALSEPITQMVVQGSRLIPDLGSGTYAWPTQGSITSRYGYRRSGFHHGLDIAAPTGTPVLAADSGMVAYAGQLPYYGNVIRLDHGGGKAVTVYGHLSKILVKQGQTVQKGHVIGHVGSTGRSTGPHLHFEVRLNGSTTDPLRLYPGS